MATNRWELVRAPDGSYFWAGVDPEVARTYEWEAVRAADGSYAWAGEGSELDPPTLVITASGATVFFSGVAQPGATVQLTFGDFAGSSYHVADASGNYSTGGTYSSQWGTNTIRARQTWGGITSPYTDPQTFTIWGPLTIAPVGNGPSPRAVSGSTLMRMPGLEIQYELERLANGAEFTGAILPDGGGLWFAALEFPESAGMGPGAYQIRFRQRLGDALDDWSTWRQFTVFAGSGPPVESVTRQGGSGSKLHMGDRKGGVPVPALTADPDRVVIDPPFRTPVGWPGE